MTVYISTKDTAKLVREALRRTFPGSKFSVRCGTGTASAWMDVTWTDGPTAHDVDAVVHQYEGWQFNSATDGYDDKGTALVVFDGAELPEEVRYLCSGINTHRGYSPAAYLHVQALLRDSQDASTLDVCDADGTPIGRGPVPYAVAVGDRVFINAYDPGHLALKILQTLDLRDVVTA